jgi:phosphate transport system permease protein
LIKNHKLERTRGKDEPIVLFRTGDITDYYTEEELGENFVNFPDKINELMENAWDHAFFSDKYVK